MRVALKYEFCGTYTRIKSASMQFKPKEQRNKKLLKSSTSSLSQKKINEDVTDESQTWKVSENSPRQKIEDH